MTADNNHPLPDAAILVNALQAIVDWKPAPYSFPADWGEQVRTCPKCESYRGHPIQQGICDDHRRPLWARKAHDKHQEVARGASMWLIAHDALRDWRQATLTTLKGPPNG